MSQLIISFNKQITKRVYLTKPAYTIGRNQICDIVLPERTISGRHAKVINTGEDCFLEDTGSTNGVYVNSRLVERHLLIDNDIIHIGKYQLTFSSDVSLQIQLRQLCIHPRLLEKLKSSWLEINTGIKQGNIIPLDRDKITLGEKDKDNITVERTLRGGYFLHRVSEDGASKTTQLSDNDSFHTGDVELVFHLAD